MLPGYRDILFVAQRRPERQPRLHFLWRVEASEQVRRSTKAGASTPATHVGRWHPGHTRRRSTKAGASTPATPDQSADRCRVPDSLNEGRSVNPGYTYPPWYDMQNCHCAQRRPERQPRLHLQAVHVQVHRHVRRSTKAGASTPATRLSTMSGLSNVVAIALNEGRSVNPGYTWPPSELIMQNCHCAQRRPERQPRLHLQARPRPGASSCASLNEGRSVNPGYTRDIDLHVRQPRQSRSTKAGASTPATRIPRSTAWTCRLHRSTKAGASTPATRTRSASNRRSSRRSSFNEGRSVNPGYTSRNVDQPTPHSTAQRRPERQPRLHTPSAVPAHHQPPAKFAQRRPERQPRLHP